VRHFKGSVTLSVPLRAEDALPLFTARGERRWVPGWEPEFPAGEPAEGEPEREGTVFVTAHGEERTFWVVAASGPEEVRYARVTPAKWAGSVAVKILDTSPAATTLEVTYDLTPLTPEGARDLTEFAAGYDAYIAEWERLIAAALG
jgi:hypothetical protein